MNGEDDFRIERQPEIPRPDAYELLEWVKSFNVLSPEQHKFLLGEIKKGDPAHLLSEMLQIYGSSKIDQETPERRLKTTEDLKEVVEKVEKLRK